MDNYLPTSSDSFASPPAQVAALSHMLSRLEESPNDDRQAEVAHENKLVSVRLGVAGALFSALRAKHAGTAAHSLRVAMSCSAWGLAVDISDEERDEIEVSALLHDVGKIGVPDHILQKASKLTAEEAATIEHHRRNGIQILTSCTESKSLLDIVHYAGAHFNGDRQGYTLSRTDLPLGARMLAIVDAFDSMTTDHVYRQALSRERAMAELFECAGTQFDPALVQQFCQLLTSDQMGFNARVGRRWLQELHPASSNALWCLGKTDSPTGQSQAVGNLFQLKLLENMHDAVVFVDSTQQILHWNRAAERLTGVVAAAVQGRPWAPELMQLLDQNRQEVTEETCPVKRSISSGMQTVHRMSVANHDGKRTQVDAHVVPVVGRDGVIHGAALLLHDASSVVDLQETVEALVDKATRDALTGVANRAEFDRVNELFVKTHLEQNKPFCLIICDIDFFKKINDTYGHQAGDDALVLFASLLDNFCRLGDLVARYGGEEFVMLCADCDNATGTAKAEELRRELAETPMPMLGGKCITASFGVTEVQAGDTPETILRRADRALLQAKDLGRNTVVQLGGGLEGESNSESKSTNWLSWFRSSTPDQLLQRTLITAMPLDVVAQKLRGFVADHHAEILNIDEQAISLKIDGVNTPNVRRNDDRPVPFALEIHFETVKIENEGCRTLIEVVVRPIRQRDRRRTNAMERARQLMASLQSYLMAQEFKMPRVEATKNEVRPTEQPGAMEKARLILQPLVDKQMEEEKGS